MADFFWFSYAWWDPDRVDGWAVRLNDNVVACPYSHAAPCDKKAGDTEAR